MLYDMVREDIFVSKISKLLRPVNLRSGKMLTYKQCTGLNIVMHRSYLCFFLVETVIKVNTASPHSKLLYYIRFGTLFVSQHFSVSKIHRS